MNMGKRIDQRLKELGWQQVDLLNAVVPLLKDGDRPLTAGNLWNMIDRDSVRSQWSEVIAQALGVTHSWLVYGTDPKFPAEGSDPPWPWPLWSVPPEQWKRLPIESRRRVNDFAAWVAAEAGGPSHDLGGSSA